MKICSNCQTAMPLKARFCPNCGERQIEVKEAPLEHILFDINQAIPEQFIEQFFLALKQRVQQEHRGENYQAFSERVYESSFRETVGRRAEELQEQVDTQKANGTADYRKINRAAEKMLEDLLDYFIIKFCPDLNQVELPQAILKHQYGNRQKSNLKGLIFDYLALDQEKERVYTDLGEMPVERLKNAGSTYLFPAKDEKILLLVDTSLLGNGKVGFAMTDQTLYWRTAFQKARKVNYRRIESIEMEKNWIVINGQFFNVNPSINLKMLKLLKKIKHWKY
ncbi:MAG TPA: zinc ribbon domain-containing protein [Saprospiraceae bacterium]|nr:zinc ribbon domain-containing protein [Saprospiraceae bacterium]